MAKNGPGRNGTPPKTGKTGPKRGEFGTQTLGGAEKGAKIQAKGSRYARHLARIFDQRPPIGYVRWTSNVEPNRGRSLTACLARIAP